MAIKQLNVVLDDGTIKYLDAADATRLVKDVGAGLYDWKEYAPEFKLQRAYFALVEEVAKNTGAGYSKDSLHAALKPMLFNKIKDNLANFKDNAYEQSTTKLTHDGWVSLIEQFKEFVNDIFGYVCK